MLLLSSTVEYTTREIAKSLKTSERTIFRYINSLKESGFIIKKKTRNIHRLIKMPLKEIELNDLLHISKEEAHILHSILVSIAGDTQIHINLERKLAALYDCSGITEIIGNRTCAENIRMLKEAIDYKQSVKLVNYESGHTMKVSDRIVEPYGFSTNYADVYAYEPTSGICKTFKITRIGWVRPIGVEWKHEEKHEVIDPDCFRMNGKQSYEVTLKMTLKAKNLIFEEYPLSQKYISYQNGWWILKTTVKDLAGVGRFVMGLADQIEILDSPELERYVGDFSRKHLHNY